MKNKITAFLKSNWILLLIVLVGLFLRAYKPLHFFMYSHDQDLAGWVARDVIFNHHFRLIGQETSSQGIFIGPLYYYLEIPFYLAAGMSPVGPLILSIIIGVASILSFYYVFSRIFNQKVGFIASTVYAVSILTVFTDREVVPTTPAMLWTVWFFYSLWKLFKGEQKFYVLAGALLGLVWDINLALGLLAPLIVLSQIFSREKINFRNLLLGAGAFVLLMSPFFVFEARHNFQQTDALVSSLTTQKDYVPGAGSGVGKLDRVMQLTYDNTTRLFWGSYYPQSLVKLTFFILAATFLYLVYKNKLSLKFGIILILWQILFVVFFTLNPINVSEYYLNGMNVVWIMIFALMLGHLMKSKRLKRLGFILIAAILVLNLRSFFLRTTNGNGYLEKQALLSFIKTDSIAHSYPCVAISYITAPGYNFGFRYLLWIDGIKTKDPGKGAPVYSIVFPLSFVDHFDERFGGLGLVLPDYSSYTDKSVVNACEGVDTNTTEPLFGYTQ